MMASFDEIAPGHDAGYRRTGFAYLHPPADVEDVRHAVKRLNELGIRVDLLDADALARDLGGFDLDGIGIVAFEHDAGYADPAGTTAGMAAGAKAAGATIRTRTAVVRLREQPGWRCVHRD